MSPKIKSFSSGELELHTYIFKKTKEASAPSGKVGCEVSHRVLWFDGWREILVLSGNRDRQTFHGLQEIKICFIQFKDEKSNIVAWCHTDI